MLMCSVSSYKWFRDPVDLTLLPDYTTRVARKDMRDLGTIKSKLENNRYDVPLDGIAADVVQLARNAHKYNGSHDLVSALATKLEGAVVAEISSIRKNLKRKGIGGNDTASPAKGGPANGHPKASTNGAGHSGNPPKKIKLSQSNGH